MPSIHELAKEGNAEAVKKKLSKSLLRKAIDVCAKDDHSWTPLHFASSNGHIETVKVILRHLSAKDINDGVNRLTMEGETAVFLAAKAGHLDVVKELVANAGSVSIADGHDWTPEVVARNFKHEKVERFLKNEARFAE